MSNEKKDGKLANRIKTIIGTVLCIILIPILIMNILLIIKSYANPEEVPNVGGTFPLIVLTDSMYPDIKSGDLIICSTVEAEDVAEGDVISFFDPMGSGTSIVTHRVLEVVEEGGELSFRTKGDNNNAEDQVPVPEDNLVGIYRSRIPGMGNVAMFMQTTPGLIICVVCPIVLLVGYDMLRRRKYDKAQQQDTDALLAELEALRKMQAQQEEAKEK